MSGINIFINKIKQDSELNNKENNKIWRILFLYFLFNMVLEVLSYKSVSIFSFFASKIWFLSGIICLLYFIFIIYSEIKIDIKANHYYFILIMCFLVAYLLMFIFFLRISDISYESALQMQAGSEGLKMPDLGYTINAFLGYPMRQYIWAVIPAAVFGHSVYTLHMGYALYFIIGITAFLLCVKRELRKNEIWQYCAFLITLILLSFRYVSEFYNVFEQTIVPISLTMMAIALFMEVRRNGNLVNIFCLSWVGCMLVTSYTPSLASAGLLMVFLMIEFCLKLKEFKKSIINQYYMLYPIICTQIVLYWLLTITNKNSTRQIISIKKGDGNFLRFIFDIIYEFFTDKNSVFWGFYTGFVLLYLILSLILALKIYNFLIAGWSMAVVLASSLALGFTDYQEPFLIYHRNLIIIPVIVFGVFYFSLQYLKKIEFTWRNKVVVSILCFILAGTNLYHSTLFNQSAVFLNYIENDKYVFLTIEEAMKKNDISYNDIFNLYLGQASGDIEGLGNMYDYQGFLYPDAIIQNVYEFDSFEDLSHDYKTLIVSKNLDLFEKNQIEPNVSNYYNQKLKKQITVYWVSI